MSHPSRAVPPPNPEQAGLAGAAPAQHDPALLLARATTDGRLGARLRACYDGRHDALDALWWRVHPLEVSPSGRSDPAVALESLRRATYSRSTQNTVPFTDPQTGAAVLVSPAEAALREAMTAIEADAVALDRALLRLSADAAAVAPPAPPPAPSPAPSPVRPTLRRQLILTAAAIAVVGLAAFSLGRLAGIPSARVDAITGADTSTTATRDGNAMTLLRSAQVPQDIPPFALGADTIASSVHRIFDGYAPEVIVYGAIGRDDRVCIIAIVTDTQSSQTCSSTERFLADGLRLRVSTAGRIVSDSGFLVPSDYEFLWAGDGSVTTATNTYSFP